MSKKETDSINNEFITASVVGKNVVITMPIDLLEHSCENRTDGCAYKVTDKELFAKEIAERIITEIRPEEDGSTQFYRLMDATFDDIFESGIECFDYEEYEKQQKELYEDQ